MTETREIKGAVLGSPSTILFSVVVARLHSLLIAWSLFDPPSHSFVPIPQIGGVLAASQVLIDPSG